MLNIAKLIPSEGKFYTFLQQLSSEAHTASLHLKTFVESTDPAARTEAGAAITSCKAQAKTISAEVTKELCISFVTPFDREDIQNICGHLYRITKTIEKVREHMDMYQMKDAIELARQVEVILLEADGMQIMVDALIKGGKAQQIIEKAKLLDELENKGDAILSDLLVTLIREAPDTKQLLLRKDIYDLLERVIDGYRDAAGVALQIALKYN
ncbi:MAG TPA: DUF47 family protein [Patescibacteria group bacterium]|nr:DUF47 family protein [Patescibacteria group bacterium]